MANTKTSDPGVVSKEALAYLKNKNLKPTFSYEDIWKEQHNKAFTVAKCMDLDLLADIKESLEEVIEKGITYKEWSKDITEKMVNKGWWGKKEMLDPKTGEIIEAQLGSSKRLKTIFQVNTRQAYQNGVWERGFNSVTHPYILYRIGPSLRHRKEHLAWDGLLLPKEHEFWKTHYPSNGYNCKCRTRFVSKSRKEKYEKEGIPDLTSTENGYPTKTIKIKTNPPREQYVTYKNKRTGETYRGIKGIDPGFEYNQGSSNQNQNKIKDLYIEKSKNFDSKILGDTEPTKESLKTPVDNGIGKIPKRYKEAAKTALNAIKKVHGDGNLPQIDIKSSSARGFAGAYSYYPALDKADCIKMSSWGQHPEFTLIHEIGHFLDHQAIGNSKGHSSANRDFEPLNKMIDKLKETEAVQSIKASRTLSNSYYLDPSELTARSYAQYITTKTKDPILLEQLHNVQTKNSDYKYSQWTEEEFKPIIKLWDNILEEMKWLKKKES